MGAVGRFFRGTWLVLDGLRRFLHLVLLLLIFGFVIGALRGSIPDLPAKAALVIRPEGDLVEQLSSDPLQRAFNEATGQGPPQTLLWDVIDSIRRAAKDTRVQVLVLELDQLGGGGQPTLEEVAAAIREFRATGKKTIAHASSYSQAQYYLAAQADEIYLDPVGSVVIDGYERYRTYYKGALDKLSIDMHLIRAGQYKSAGETYTRKDMSAQDREESLAYLQALWAGYQRAVTTARKLPADAIATYANGFLDNVTKQGGDAAQLALDAKLVTGLRSGPQVERRLIELVGEDTETHSYNVIRQADYVRIVHAEQRLPRGGPQVVVINAAGEIMDGDQPPGTIGGESTAALVREARRDDDVKAVVLRIDSPGGTVLASEQIYREVLALREAGKPVVASFGDVAASGGYYIAAPANRIFASPNTITGSIGVFATFPTADRALNKLGITVDGIGTTPLSGQLRLDRPLEEPARRYLQATVDRSYEQFLGHVSAGRGKTRDQIHEIGQGRVWAGTDAGRLGLVDQLGSYDEAIKAAAALAHLTQGYNVRRMEPELSWAQQLALQLNIRVARLAGRLGAGPARLQHALEKLSPLAAELARWERLSTASHNYAYCFCTVD